ncbi:MAG: L-histidine N(alpha)-methyltransferase [Myxococcota bacterium]
MVEQRFEVIDEDAAARATSPQELAYEVLVGLSSTPKRLPSRYFYDDRGSELFQEIMNCEEYYLTNCEDEILRRHAADICATMKGPFDLVDLGAGDGAKTRHLLGHLVESGAEVTYVPVDISEGAMRGLVAAMGADFPTLEIHGLVAEYTGSLRWLGENRTGRPKLVLFLGSNIGNFDRAQARGFLSRIWTHLEPEDRLLIGFDLKKDIELLLAAYNDVGGVTAAFNLNLLTRINRELGANFDIRQFRHYGTYEVLSGAMESYLVSLVEQEVRVDHLGRGFHFQAWEPIHTEYSYKYLRSDVEGLARDSGFQVEQRFTDERARFIDDVWQPVKAG